MANFTVFKIDSETSALLERAARDRSPRRSEFVRDALLRAFGMVEEKEARADAPSTPDSSDTTSPEPRWETWDASEPKRPIPKG